MTTLLLADLAEGKLGAATSRVLTAALQFGTQVHILIAGEGIATAAEEASALYGVEKIVVADDPAFAHMLAEPLANLIVQLAPGYSAILASNASSGKNVLPRVAAILDVMQVTEITKVLAKDTFERPIYAGNAVQTVGFCGHGCRGQRVRSDRDGPPEAKSSTFYVQGRNRFKIGKATACRCASGDLGGASAAKCGKLHRIPRPCS